MCKEQNDYQDLESKFAETTIGFVGSLKSSIDAICRKISKTEFTASELIAITDAICEVAKTGEAVNEQIIEILYGPYEEEGCCCDYCDFDEENAWFICPECGEAIPICEMFPYCVNEDDEPFICPSCSEELEVWDYDFKFTCPCGCICYSFDLEEDFECPDCGAIFLFQIPFEELTGIEICPKCGTENLYYDGQGSFGCSSCGAEIGSDTV